MSDEWVGVDLDRTLAFYDRWHGAGHIGKPIPKMLKRVKQWLKEGKTVKVMTARVSSNHHPVEIQEFMEAFSEWSRAHFNGIVLDVTAEKDGSMTELWDDRAVLVVPITGERVDGRD